MVLFVRGPRPRVEYFKAVMQLSARHNASALDKEAETATGDYVLSTDEASQEEIVSAISELKNGRTTSRQRHSRRLKFVIKPLHYSLIRRTGHPSTDGKDGVASAKNQHNLICFGCGYREYVHARCTSLCHGV